MRTFVAMLLANLMRSGRACMLPLGLCPSKGASCARIIAGLRALVLCQSHTCSCPSVTGACAPCSVFGLVLTLCPLRWAGGCAWHGLTASALSAPGMHVGDERHSGFECPAFDDIRRGFQHLFYDSRGAMRLLRWHACQKDVASCLLQLLDRIDETLT